MSPSRRAVKRYGRLKALVRRIGATLESDSERRHEGRSRAEPRVLCSLVSALFLAESDKLSGHAQISLSHWGGTLDGFTTDVLAIAGARGGQGPGAWGF